MATTAQLQQELHQKREELNHFVKQKPTADWTADDIKTFNDRHNEVNELAEKWEAQRDIDERVRKNEEALEAAKKGVTTPYLPGTDNTGPDGGRKSAKSLADQFFEATDFKSRATKGVGFSVGAELPDVDVKTTLVSASAPAYATGASNTLTSVDFQAGLRLIGMQPLTIADLFAQGETTSALIRYVQEKTFTNAAGMVAEGGTKPEAAFDLNEVDAPVRKVAVRGRVSDEMLADFAYIRGYINDRLPLMVSIKLEDQLLNGTASATNITGVLQTSGISTQAKSTDPAFDAVLKAITKVWTGSFLRADAIVMNPTDWQNLVLARDGGMYILGNPGETPGNRIWGYTLVQTTAIAAGTALVGAFKAGGQVFYREGMRLEATNSNEDDFNKNLVSIRAEIRAALAVYTPKAFCSVTGL